MNNPKLERCPFCGGDGRVHRQYYNPTRVISTRFEGQFTQALPAKRIGFAVECEKCLSVGDVAETKEEAAKLWNRRTPLPENKAVDMVLGRGELGVAIVVASEGAPPREVLIYRLPSPVLPIGSSLGDEGKSVVELENVLVRMHFENAESAHVLERAVRRVLDSFGEPDNKALTVEELRGMDWQPVWVVCTEMSACTGWYLVGKYYDGTICMHCADNTLYEKGLWRGSFVAYRRPPEKGD